MFSLRSLKPTLRSLANSSLVKGVRVRFLLLLMVSVCLGLPTSSADTRLTAKDSSELSICSCTCCLSPSNTTDPSSLVRAYCASFGVGSTGVVLSSLPSVTILPPWNPAGTSISANRGGFSGSLAAVSPASFAARYALYSLPQAFRCLFRRSSGELVSAVVRPNSASERASSS